MRSTVGTRTPAICANRWTTARTGSVFDGTCHARPQPPPAAITTKAAATTYWLYSEELRRRLTAVDVRPDQLYVEDGPVLTSAGLAAGIDLWLHLIRSDHGAAVANEVARLAVVSPLRSGAQAQQVPTPVPPTLRSDRCRPRWSVSDGEQSETR